MAENDVNLKLLIEAEDRSREALDQARRNTQQLVQQQKDLWRQVQEADDAEISGNKEKALSAEKYFETRKKAAGATEEINKSYRREKSALAQLNRDHDASAKAVEKANQAKAKSTHAAGNALTHYLKHFVSIAAAEEVIRRSITEYANWERGMARIEIQTGATSTQTQHLGHSIDGLARLTGISVLELQKNFMTFQAGVGQMGSQVEHAFEDVVRASHAAGVSVDVMGRTAIAALKTMNVPYGELKGMLDVIVDEIPASAMQAWDAVGPKILGVMRSIGGTGRDSVGQAAQAFGTLTQVLGSAQEAGNVHLEMMKKATDQSSFFGKMMTPQLIEMEKGGASATQKFEAFYQTMDRLGVFDEDPQRALFMQQRYGFSDAMIRGIQEGHKLHQQIAAEVEKTGKSWPEVEKHILRLNRGPKAAIDDLVGSLGELLTALGKFLGPTIPDTLSGYVKGLTADIQLLEFWFEKFREKTGSRKPAEKDAQGNITKPAEETPYHFDPGAWFATLMTGTSRKDQIEADKGKEGFAWSKPLYGYHDFLLYQLLGLPRMPEKKPDSGDTRSTTGPMRGRGGGAVPDTGPRPGYATGGEFVVPGQGGRDTQPVEFMATPGERVAVTTPMQESLQNQQDKADQAARDHFARFRTSAFTKTVAGDWWPKRDGTGAGAGSRPMGAIPDMAGTGPDELPRSRGGPRAPGGDHDHDAAPPATPTTKVPTSSDPDSPDGPANDVDTAIKRGYLKPNVTGEGQRNYTGGNTKQQTAQIVANQLRAQGYKEHVIAGILQNADSESGMNPANKHFDQPRFRGTEAQNAHGLWQFGGKEYNDWMKWMDKKGYPRDKWTDPRIQAEWIGDRIKDPQYAKLKKRLDEATTKEEAAVAFLQDYERPAAKHRAARTNKYERGVPTADHWTGGPGVATTPGEGPKFAATTVEDLRKALEGGGGPDAAAVASEGSGAGVIRMQNKNAIRDKPLDANTRAYLEYASLRSGLEVHVGSGGQDAHGHRRTGSHRHDLGGAADYKLWDPEKKRYLDFKNEADRNRMEAFVQDTSKAGATGQGAGRRYMGTQTIHTGGGSEATWGEEGKGGFVSRGHAAGRRERLTPEQLRIQLAELRQQRDTRLAAAEEAKKNKAATAPTNTRVATLVPPSSHTHHPGDGHEHPPTPPGVPPAGYRALLGTPAAPAPAPAPAPEPAPAPAPEPEQRTPGARQAGGAARAGAPYMVGEAGPELFKPNMPGNIFPHGMMPPMPQMPQGMPQMPQGMPDLAGMFAGGMPGGFDFGGALAQFRELADEISKPLRASVEMPRAGPMRQRMSRRVEAQRERDVGRMSRHAANSDIGMS